MEIPRLHPDTIEEVKQRVDILDVISDHVVLRKRGKDFLGLCPFHDEKTPSFSVSSDKQVYYCFGCGTGGNVFKFLMQLNKQSFSDVVFDLAQRYQVPIKTLQPEQKQELQRQISLREQLYEILAVAADFYQHALRQPQGKIALNYLKEERKLSEATIQDFSLGYAPAGWETLYRYLIEIKKYSLTLVEEAGLIKKRKSGQGHYDRFRDRLMIPIRDTKGRIIAFGSRTLADEKPKYLNSPETSLFDKSKTLFALDRARDSISKEDRAIVVEGYFDAIALHSFGITNAVASLGTAFTKNQLQQVLRYTPSNQVILNFDADFAGIKATQRAISEIESEIYSGQVKLRVLHLPGGKDADEFLQTSPNAVDIYHDSISNAPLWLDWQIEQLVFNKNLKQADVFQEVAKNIVQILSKIDNRDLRTAYIIKSAEFLYQGDAQDLKLLVENISIQVETHRKRKRNTRFKKELKKSIELPDNKRAVNKKNNDPSLVLDLPSRSSSNLLESAETDILRIYLHYPEHRKQIITALEDKDLLFSLPHHRFLWQQIIQLNIDPTQSDPENELLFNLQNISSQFTDNMPKIVNILYSKRKEYRQEKLLKEDITNLPTQINNAIATLEYVICEKYKNYCLQQVEKLDNYQDADKMKYYFQESIEAQKKLEKLHKQRCEYDPNLLF
ncbi:MAG: DNA primase [Prochloraceae cyanobacterium]|nr:DNA primase [Prochloraceae cyanobacterium]